MNRARRHPVRRVSLAAFTLALLILGPAITLAQSDSTATSPYAELAAGDRIRLTTTGSRRIRTVGTFVAMRADTLVMQSEWDDTTMSRVLDANTTLELSDGRSGNITRNILIGTLIGGGIALLLSGIPSSSADHYANEVIIGHSTASIENDSAASAGILSAVAFLGVVGVLLGSRVLGHEDWRMLTPQPEPTAYRDLASTPNSITLVTLHFK